jgi:23S rRNA (adenine2503-C2)-methyltransferase
MEDPLKPDIKNLTRAGIEAWLTEQGAKPFNAFQIVNWLYDKQVESFDEMTNLSKPLRQNLKENFIHKALECRNVQHSKDGSKKFLFALADGALVESVQIFHPRRQSAGAQKHLRRGGEKRLTLCVSSQVGCAMGCTFCSTAQMKLKRNLTPAEILGQVLAIQKQLTENEKLTNIVFMGMGEPFHNFDQVMQAIDHMIDPNGFALAQRRITVSTSGLVPAIEKMAARSRVQLAVSLNASHDELRNEIMPINRKYPIAQLLSACHQYSQDSGKRVTFEYVLLGGLNDTMKDAKRLAKLLSGLPCKINLIPYNEFPGSPYQRPTEATIEAMAGYLAGKHLQVNIRWSKGLDISGACGQLATS